MARPRTRKPPPGNDCRTPLERGTLSVEEACEILGIGTSTGYRLVRAGTFPVKVRMIGATRKVLKAEMTRYLNGEGAEAS